MSESKERKDATPTIATQHYEDDYVLSSLEQIRTQQAAQSRIEAERTGAAKTTSMLIAVFGSTITAAAIGCFVWVWEAHASNSLRDARIEALTENPPTVHGHALIERDVRSIEHRLVVIEASYAAINERLDRIEREEGSRHEEVIDELRRIRGGTTRPTWGGQ